MKRLLAAFLTATFLIPPTFASALRTTELAETGLEEQLRAALTSGDPNDLVNSAQHLTSRALGLVSSARPELSRRAGLEEKALADAISNLERAVSTDPNQTDANRQRFIERTRTALKQFQQVALPDDLKIRTKQLLEELFSFQRLLSGNRAFHDRMSGVSPDALRMFSKDEYRNLVKTSAAQLRDNLRSLLRDLQRYAKKAVTFTPGNETNPAAGPATEPSAGGLEESSTVWVAERLNWLKEGDNQEREVAAWGFSDRLSRPGRTSAKRAMFKQAPALVKALSDNLKDARKTRKFYFWDALAHMAARRPFHDALLKGNLDDLIKRGLRTAEQNVAGADETFLRHAAAQFLENLARFERFQPMLSRYHVNLKALANGRLSAASRHLNASAAGLEETPEPRTYAEIEAIRQAELEKPGVREAIKTWVDGKSDPNWIPSLSVFDFAGQQGIQADVVHLWLRQNGYSVDTSGGPLFWKKVPTAGLEESSKRFFKSEVTGPLYDGLPGKGYTEARGYSFRMDLANPTGYPFEIHRGEDILAQFQVVHVNELGRFHTEAVMYLPSNTQLKIEYKLGDVKPDSFPLLADAVEEILAPLGFTQVSSYEPDIKVFSTEAEIKIRTVAELSRIQDATAQRLAQQLESTGKAGTALLSAEVVEYSSNLRELRQVMVYAHEGVRQQAVELLPMPWNWDGRVSELSPDPTQAAAQLQQAAKLASEQGKTLVVALDAGQEIDASRLSEVRAVKMLLDPQQSANWARNLRPLHAFLSRPDVLLDVLLDLTSGSALVVTIQGREYYALGIAA